MCVYDKNKNNMLRFEVEFDVVVPTRYQQGAPVPRCSLGIGVLLHVVFLSHSLTTSVSAKALSSLAPQQHRKDRFLLWLMSCLNCTLAYILLQIFFNAGYSCTIHLFFFLKIVSRKMNENVAISGY